MKIYKLLSRSQYTCLLESNPVLSTYSLCSNTIQQKDNKTVYELDTEQDRSLPIAKLDPKNREMIDTQVTLSIQIIPWNPITNLPLNGVGTYLLPLYPKPKGNSKLIYEVCIPSTLSRTLQYRLNLFNLMGYLT